MVEFHCNLYEVGVFMYKVCCLNKISEVGKNIIQENNEIVDNINLADAVIVRSSVIEEDSIHDNLLAIARAGSGVNNIPVEFCSQKGIVVFNTPGANANAVKELVISGLFLAARNIIQGSSWLMSEVSNESVVTMTEKMKKKFTGSELYGKNIGVIGLGAIGVLVANACANLGMNVYGYDPFLSVDNAITLSNKVKVVKDISCLYRRSDYVTVHVPLTESTRHMINADSFAKMKKNAVLLNFSRADIVDVDALESAMNTKIKCYVTDFPTERVMQLKRTVVLPHLGASTIESEKNCAVMAANQVRDYLENGNVRNSVNFPECVLGKVECVARLCVVHVNLPSMIAGISTMLGGKKINIQKMVSCSKEGYAYAIFDLDNALGDSDMRELSLMSGVLKLRQIGKSM